MFALYGLEDVDARVVMASVVAQLLCGHGLNREARLSEFHSLVEFCFARTDAGMGVLSNQQSAAMQ
jgi:hypothetical protein